MIFRDGWYYLLVTHGSCCAGANSSYNIRMGRARKVSGPVRRQHGHRHAPGRRQAVSGIAAGATSAQAISGCSISATACRSSRCTTRPTSIAAASACSTSVRCSGATAGPWRETTSRRGRIRSSPRARARRSNWPSKACRSAAPADAAVAAPGARRWTRRRAWRWTGRRSDPGAGRVAGVRKLARRRDRRAHVALHGAGAAKVDRHVRSPMPAAIPDRRTSRSPSPGPIARSRRRPTANWWCFRVHWRTRAAVAHRPADRRHVSRDAQGHAGLEGTAGVVCGRQQHADARPIQSATAIGSAGCSRHREPDEHVSAALAMRSLAPSSPRWPSPSRQGAGPRAPRRRSRRPRRPSKRRTPTAFCSDGWSSSQSARAGQLTDSAVQTLVKAEYFPGS